MARQKKPADKMAPWGDFPEIHEFHGDSFDMRPIVRVRVYPDSGPATTLIASPAAALGLLESEPPLATRVRTWHTMDPECRIMLTLYASEDGLPNTHLPALCGPLVLAAHCEPVATGRLHAVDIDDVLKDGTADAVLYAFGQFVRKIAELGLVGLEQAAPFQEALANIRLDVEPQVLLALGA